MKICPKKIHRWYRLHINYTEASHRIPFLVRSLLDAIIDKVVEK